jgi:hypothetical protein
MKVNNNQAILVVFMVIVFLVLNRQFMEPFANKNRKRKDNSSKRKNKKYKKKKQRSNKENFINMGITNLFKGFMSQNNEDNKKDNKVNKINKREKERHDMINNKPSKNTTDSMYKFSALKQGLYDIIEMGNMMSY